MATREVTLKTSTDYVDGVMELKDTKTHNERENTLPAYVIEVAKAWKAEQMQGALKLGDKWKGYHGKEYDKKLHIYTTQWHSNAYIAARQANLKGIIRLYNQCVADTPEKKIPEDVSPHGLRHSVAAILIANNVDVRTVAGILGHADPTTTLNIYSYFFQKQGQRKLWESWRTSYYPESS